MSIHIFSEAEQPGLVGNSLEGPPPSYTVYDLPPPPLVWFHVTLDSCARCRNTCWTEAVFTNELSNKFAKYLVWIEKLIHLNKKHKGFYFNSKSIKFGNKIYFLNSKKANLEILIGLCKEGVNFIKL